MDGVFPNNDNNLLGCSGVEGFGSLTVQSVELANTPKGFLYSLEGKLTQAN